MLEFEKVEGRSNELLRVDDFYISFNQNPCEEWGSFFAGDGGSSETALCCDDSFYILNGDFRSEYIEAANSKNPFDACVAVFRENEKEHRSSWSTDTPITDWLAERVLTKH